MVQEVKVQTDTSLVGILVASFIFIISLAWNDAFKTFFSTSTPFLKRYGPWAYAIIVTALGFFLIQFLTNNKLVQDIQNTVEQKEEVMKDAKETVESFYRMNYS
tara:strand:+ start:1770 stop:2081 length:312 start_codon:yes stop_codon:yes gene_type:complete